MYDYIIIGSGFGGSVSALRLTEKGKKVLVLEKGRRFAGTDFPSSNWQFKKWMWAPALGMRGPFRASFFKHITVYSGIGVGGGSLVYANTLPVPKSAFFNAESWGHLSNWEAELAPHYQTALKMLGAAPNPRFFAGDEALRSVARDLGKEDHFSTTNVAVYFGEQGKTVPDPYFGGKGPTRTGCNFCAACMLGCPNNAKNTLDKNYLYLAEAQGAEVKAEHRVLEVKPLDGKTGASGYEINGIGPDKQKFKLQAKAVIFSAGAIGTNELLLNLKRNTLPNLSDMLGHGVRTNSESLLGATTFDPDIVMSEGIAISSILHTDDNSHLEVVRYPAGSGAFRPLMTPAVMGNGTLGRLAAMMGNYITEPIRNLKGYFTDDWAKRTQILLFMQTVDSTLQFVRSGNGIQTKVGKGTAPTPFIPEAHELAKRFAEKVKGKSFALLTETALGVPSTAHILGGACMGSNATNGVTDTTHRLFNYDNLFVADGSIVSANPGVNPSLTITALTERMVEGL